MDLSIVTTLFQSAPYVRDFYARAREAAVGVASTFEIIFVNDGSPDDSLDRVLEIQRQDPHVRVVDLSRNFGHHKAMMTGLERATGDLTFLIDSDLEEDPAWLARFHATLKETNADVVYGVQARRKGGWFERASGYLYYAAFNALLDHPLPRNLVTVRLMTRRYVEQLVRHREREMFIAGLWVITGFKQVPVTVAKGRRDGHAYRQRQRISVLINALTSFSNRPLIYIFYVGSGLMAISATAGLYLIWRALRHGIGVPGYASLIVSVWFLGGLTIFSLGVIGIYLAKVFVEVKDRPYTIVRAEYGCSSEVAR
jgi:putative glycosyltransferase